MDPISKFPQSFQKRPTIQVTILRFPAASQLIDCFLILIKLTLVYSFAQRSTYSGVCCVFTLQNHH